MELIKNIFFPCPIKLECGTIVVKRNYATPIAWLAVGIIIGLVLL